MVVVVVMKVTMSVEVVEEQGKGLGVLGAQTRGGSVSQVVISMP